MKQSNKLQTRDFISVGIFSLIMRRLPLSLEAWRK